MSIKVNDFRWEKGKNDLEYIALLERNHAVMLDNFRKCAKVAKEQYNKGKADGIEFERRRICLEELEMINTGGISGHNEVVTISQTAFEDIQDEIRADERRKVIDELSASILNSCKDVKCKEDITIDNDFDFYASELLEMLEQLKGEQK